MTFDLNDKGKESLVNYEMLKSQKEKRAVLPNGSFLIYNY